MSASTIDHLAQVAELALLLAMAILQAFNRHEAKRQVHAVEERVSAVVRSVDSLRPIAFVSTCTQCHHPATDHDDHGCRERYCGCPGWANASEENAAADQVRFENADETPIPRNRLKAQGAG